jgi:hypothetical protein
LPSAQPETKKRTVESAQDVPKEDLISRKAAIELFADAHPLDYISQAYLEKIRALPSVKPKIVRCKECKHWRSGDGAFGRCYVVHEDEEIGTYKTMMECFAEDFCSWAERREE